MSDIFISYKREEQNRARQLAVGLEKQGWSVWWDPKLRAGDHFDDVIEKALDEARCVIVMWSKRSVRSRYVRDESAYALDCDKLVPVAIEDVKLPLRFRNIHTSQLIDWDGSEQFLAFKSLVDDIATKVGQPAMARPELVSAVGASEDNRLTDTVIQDTLNDGSKGPEMVLIQGGHFYMGSDPEVDSNSRDDERPRHKVSIETFYMGKYPVTIAEYDAFAQATERKLPYDEGWGRGRQPVINVTWRDALAFTEWLSEQTGKSYRLPTEAEWEYAARAGTETPWYWGDSAETASDYAWYSANSDGHNHTVGGKRSNHFGLHDMAGNVWEWTEDCWHDDYNDAPKDGRAWLEEDGGNCQRRVVRGGSERANAYVLRSARRFSLMAVYRSHYRGFRVVCRPHSSTGH